jgi:hypothetical protein
MEKRLFIIIVSQHGVGVAIMLSIASYSRWRLAITK